MRLQTKTFAQYVRDMSVAAQGATGRALDLSVGTVFRAIFEANASVVLWLQALVADLMSASRAATAAGGDLDSWMADFALFRQSATNSVGLVRFSRHAAIGGAIIPVGSRVATSDGKVVFEVVRDRDHLAWTEADGGYQLTDGQPAVDLPVSCESPGPVGNVQASTVTLLMTSIAGVDDVVNPAPIGGGLDAETDSAFRRRFVDYIDSRSRGTVSALRFAIQSVRQGIEVAILENQNADGSERLGHFVVTVDDGTGVPPSGLLTEIAEAVERVRPLGVTFEIMGPSVIVANVGLSVTVRDATAMAANQIRADVGQVIAQYINGLGIGASLSQTRLAMIAYQVSDHIANVSGVLINGSAQDLVPGPRQAIKAGTVGAI